MALPMYVTLLVTITAAVAVFGDSIYVDEGVLDENVLDQELATLLLAEENATTSYAGRRNPPNWPVKFVSSHNYPIEAHQVETKDGYLLTLHRIPGSKDRTKKNGQPILMHHGFLGAAGDWIVLGPQKALAFILADLGYDVWMANARGTTDSRKHSRLNPDQSAFWDFSWHDIGEKDLPAEIDYILATTSKPNLTYIGYSMGTTAFYVMCSERPEYVRKVNKMIGLGPVAYMQHVRGPLLRYLAPLATRVAALAKLLGARGEFAPSTTFVQWAAKKFCSRDPKSQAFCSNILFMLFGFTGDYVDSEMLGRIAEFAPAGASIKAMTHFSQLIKHAPTFRQYDYGLLKNGIRYKRTSPPNYELSRTTCPVHLFVSENDWFATVNDSTLLLRNLPNVKTAVVLGRPSFTHFDFIYSRDADQLVYQQIINIIKN